MEQISPMDRATSWVKMATTIQPQIRTLGPPVNSRQVPKLMLREDSTATAVKQKAKDMKPLKPLISSAL